MIYKFNDKTKQMNIIVLYKITEVKYFEEK